MKLSKRISSFLMVIVLIQALPVTALAKHEVKKEINYVAFGDSLAAGMTPYGEISKSYVDYLVNDLQQSDHIVHYQNYGVPGYTSEQLKNDVLFNKNVKQSIKEAKLITIDIGSNDLLPLLNTNPAQIPAAIGNVAANLQVILHEIDLLNHHVNVYVMGYYNPFPYATPDQQVQLLALLHLLNVNIADRSYANGDTFVPTEAAIAENYPSYMPNPFNIHLSLEGYQRVADEFWNAIEKSKLDDEE